MRPPSVRALAVAALLCAGGWSTARAGSDTHYQDELIGERAAGMGGAFVALADEATGAYYNPAGIAVGASNLLQLQMSAYRWRLKKTTAVDLCGRRIERDEGGLFGFPASLGFVKTLGDGQPLRHAVGLMLAIPHLVKESTAYAVRDARCAGFAFDGGGAIFVSDRVFSGGLTYALAWRWLQVGITLGIGMRGFATALNSTALLDAVPNYPISQMTYADVNHWGLHVALGAIVEPLEGLRFGLTLTTPRARLAGSGRLDGYSASTTGARGTVSKILLEDAEFRWKVPLALAFGAAYRTARFTVAADARVHLPVSAYQTVEHPRLPAGTDTTIEREAVVNVNLGGEARLGKAWGLRGGFFTNFSSFPDVSTAAAAGAEQIDLFGFTLGATYRSTEQSTLSANVQLGFGSGDRAVTEVSAAPGQTIQTRTVVTSSSETSLVLGVGGSFDIR